MVHEINKKLIETCIKSRRRWIAKNGRFVRDSSLEDLEQDLCEGTYDSAKVIGIGLSGLATYFGTRGLVDLFDGKDGWPDVDLAVHYRYWKVKFAAGVMFRELAHGPPPSPLRLHHELPLAASLFCYSVVHDREDWRNELWDLLKRIVTDSNTVRGDHWAYEERYLLYVVRCFSRTPLTDCFVLPKELEDFSLEPYVDLLEQWENSDEIHGSLMGICNYHCQQLVQKTARDPWPSFIDSPFDLAPYEVLAILKLRKLLDIEMPIIDHPLMALPTASQTAREIKPINDPMFGRLQQLYDAHCA